MKIHLSQVGRANKSLCLTPPSEWMAELCRDHPYVTEGVLEPLTVEITHLGQDVLVRGAACWDIIGPCTRCLEGVELCFKAPFAYLFQKGAPEPDFFAEDGPSQGDAEILPFDGEVIDLSPLLRELILVHLPIQVLCRDDCRGLCPRCGENLNLRSCECAEAPRESPFAVLKEKFNLQ